MASAATYTTAELADLAGGELHGRSDLTIRGVNALDEAGPDDITFLADAAHARRWSASLAAAAVINRGLNAAGHDPRRRALIVVPDAQLAMVDLLSRFAPAVPAPEPGVHPTAIVHDAAILGRGVRVGPHVTIDRGTRVGDGAVLHAGVRLYAEAEIGEACVLHANVVVRERCRLGRRVLIHQNASIGADGFGFVPAPDGTGPLRVPQIGIVVIDDDVEIGAGTCIDRAKFGATRIGARTKIDNLVQIGHNCRIGRGCVIAGLTGLAGSVTIGDGVRLGGAVGIADHVVIGDGATVGAKSGVMRDVPPGATCVGYPARPSQQFFREIAALKRLPEWLRRASRLLKVDIQ